MPVITVRAHRGPPPRSRAIAALELAARCRGARPPRRPTGRRPSRAARPRRTAAKTTAPSSRPAPAVRGLAGSTTTRSARWPTAIAPASSQPSEAWPVGGGGGEQLGGRSSARAAGWPAARRARRRASPRRGRSRRGCRSRGSAGRPASCEPAARADAVAEVALGGRAEARRRRRLRRSARCRRRSGGWRAPGVVVGRSRPWSASSRAGVTPYASRQASFSATCSERCTWNGRPPTRAATAVERRRPAPRGPSGPPRR